MANKKHQKRRDTETSSESESTNSDSSSSSDSRDSSPAPKRSKKEVKKHSRNDSKNKRESVPVRDRSNFPRSSKDFSEIESYKATKRSIVEASKWDSPQQKSDHRKDKRTEKQRRSESLDNDAHKTKNTSEKQQELEKRERDRQGDYNKDRRDDAHRYDKRDRKYDNKDNKDRHSDGNRTEYSEDRNRGNRDNRKDYKGYVSRQYSYNRRNTTEQRDREGRNSRSYDSKRYSNDRGNSREQSRNRSERYQDKYRNRRHRSRSASLEAKDIKWGKGDDNKTLNKLEKSKEKDKPNFGLSGKLTEETNTYRGVVIKYSEPPEARKPKRRWRLYPFKGEKALQTLYIHRESAYLIGRERKVVDLPIDHPSCSKQHAVLQYRLVPFTRDDGSTGKRVRPYLIDLDSANGTFINNKKIESKKYVELLEKDVIKFGYSSREYVLLHENSKDEAQDDDVKDEEVYEPSVKKEKD